LAQDKKHTYKFEQMELRSPNDYRTASGAPGSKYWQNTADYVMDIELNDENQSIKGKETITYTNNSPDELGYLWLQLDQNLYSKDNHTYASDMVAIQHVTSSGRLNRIMPSDFDGGFKIAYVKGMDGKPLSYTINKTMMVVDLPKAMKTGDKFSFQIEWSFNIVDRLKTGSRSGWEYFEADKNYLYTIAQFFPRMCVYSDNQGWQNKQFLGAGEFTLPFGSYKVSLTVPADHIVAATGYLQNTDKVLTSEQIKRLKEAEKATKPVIIATQAEAVEREKGRSKEKKTWVFAADNIRDFAFATSRKMIWDAMGVNLNGRIVMAMSYYPKEGNPLWEEYSTRVVAQTLKTYSKYTFDYPYDKAISVHAADIGMEYPMICFNLGRPNPDGTYDEREKHVMQLVIIHEVGHNFFPMIVNSDERQWTWMDEGLNTFLQYLTEKEWDANFPSESGPPQKITWYMKLPKEKKSPIMTNSEQIQHFGPNAYSQPATALNILRETIMGKELFDRAFKEYARRWKFKHPTPEDFFRTMEDASAVDLDWFWKGWFYSTDHVDIAISNMKKYKMTKQNAPQQAQANTTTAVGDQIGGDYEIFYSNMEDKEKVAFDTTFNFYEIELQNVGGIVMPVILEFAYKDGTKEIIRIPAEIWRKNDEKITKVFPRKKELDKVTLDPFLETADVDVENNVFPKADLPSKLEIFKEKGANNGGK
jgi:hypothetical protein